MNTGNIYTKNAAYTMGTTAVIPSASVRQCVGASVLRSAVSPGGMGTFTLLHLCTFILLLLQGLASTARAAAPDLTIASNRFTVDRTYTYNLGPTGMRGWLYRSAESHTQEDGTFTGDQPWQILVTDVGTGTPAVGILQVNDVIVGVQAGTSGAVPLFTADSRKSLGWAIGDAEAGNGKLSLMIDRYGVSTDQYYTIQLGLTGLAYSATAPYACPKSAKILATAVNIISNMAIGHPVDGLAKMAAGIPGSSLQSYALSLLPSGSLNPYFYDGSSYISWDWGYKNLFLTEYFLLTGDKSVTNGIQTFAIAQSHAQDLCGLYGHRGNEDHHDGSFNGGTMGYGPMNSASLPNNISIVLAQKCGISHPDLVAADDRASLWYGYFVDKGSLPYGEHEPWWYHGSNGKNAMAAMFFALQGDKPEQAKYYERMTVAETRSREYGHTGQGFSYLWTALAAHQGGATSLVEFIKPIRWHLDLSRRSDGSFIYDGAEQYGGSAQPSYWGGASYGGQEPTAWYVLLYSLPNKRIYISGKNLNPTNELSVAEVSNAVWSADYHVSVTGYSTNELIGHFSEYDPIVRRWAAQELAARPNSNALVSVLIDLTTNADLRVRGAACEALGRIKNASALPALGAALYDTSAWVRTMASKAMISFGSAASPQLTNMLTAYAYNASLDPYSLNPDDPVDIARDQLGLEIFGTLASSAITQPTNLLCPAVAVGLSLPGGHGRTQLRDFIEDRLTWTHVQYLASNIVAGAKDMAPFDRMFAKEPVLACIRVLGKYSVEEGIPLAVRHLDKYIYGIYGGVEQEVMYCLSNTYRGSAREALPALNQYKPYVSGDKLLSLTNTINAIQNMSGPALMYFKSIASCAASPSAVTLPTTNVALSCFVTDMDMGVPFYAWSKTQGVGSVTFSPNSSTAASNVTATFSAPGTYVIQMACVDKSILDTDTWKWSGAEPAWRDFKTYTNIIGAVYTNLTVIVYDRPFVNITNSDFGVSMYLSATPIGGTNNAAVVGGMRLSSVTGTTTNYAANILAASPWSAIVSNLIDAATNVVTITGTNTLGVATGDTVRIYRPALAFLDITNSGATVTLPASSNTWRVAGTNNALVVGGMVWTNAAIGGGNGTLSPASGDWSFNVTLLVPGFNRVTIYGTNVIADLASDSVTIIKGEPPMVAITNVQTGVVLNLPSTAANQYLAGTNTSVVVGGMRWTNALGGANGTVTLVGGTQWNCTPPLQYGTNILIVSGTNAGGYAVADTASVYRATLPFVDITNTSFTVSMYTDAAKIGGTNTAKAVGGMRLVSVTGTTTNYSAAFPATLSWTASVSNLVGGATNFVAVTVTNDLGEAANDTIQIYRKPMAVVDITNLTGTVQMPNTTTNQLVAGTNNQFIVGTMWWTNTLVGGGTMGVGSTGWTFDATISAFYPGLNVITVYGTNDIGDVASDTVTIAVPSPRQFFWTNAVGGVWSAAGNWTNELGILMAPAVVGSPFYSINFSCGGTYTANNDFPGGFMLNKLTLGAGVPTLRGNRLTFTNDGANLPQLNHNVAANLYVTNDFFFATNVTFAGSAAQRLQLYGAISGPGGLIKNGNNQLQLWPSTLRMTNTYTGGTIFNSGTLFGHGGYPGIVVFGTGPITVNGGSFQPQQISVSNVNEITLNGGTVANGNSFGTAWYGPIILNTNFPMTGNGSIDLYGNISGPGGINWTDTVANRSLGLRGTNTYTGPTTVMGQSCIICWDVPAIPPGTLDIRTNAVVRLPTAGTRAIDSLYLSGVSQADGEYGAIGSMAPNQSVYFTNSAGTVTVVGPYVDITNLSGVVFLSVDTQEVVGINSSFTVGLWWENSLGGGGTLDPAPGAWSFTADVYDGNNIIAVYSTNALGVLRADTVTLYRTIAPFIDITNENFSVPMDETYTYIGGTNNAGPLGDMTLTSVAGGTTNYVASTSARTPWTILVGNLLENTTNYVTVLVTNNIGEWATDTVEIYRPQHVYVDITNIAGVITTTNASVYVAGTNNVRIVDNLWWTNSLGGGGTLANGGWNFTAPLTLGTNVITVSGTNILGAVGSKAITVIKRSVSSDKDMLTFGPGAVITGTNIEWGVPYGTVLTALAPTYTVSQYAWAAPPSGSTQDFSTPQEYVVTAEDLSTNVYTVTAIVLPTSTNYFWTNTVGGVWSDVGNWTNPDGLPFGPVHSGFSFYQLNFNAAGTFAANNNLADGFVLNQLNLGGSGVTLMGNDLTLTNDDGQLPQVNHNVSANLSVSNDLLFATNVTFAGTSANRLQLYGALSGPGGMVKDGPGQLYIYPNPTSQPNTYSGGTVFNNGTISVQGENLNWFAAFGTGPVTINGGSFAPQMMGTANVNRLTFNGGSWANGNSFGTAWYGPIDLNVNLVTRPNGEIALYGNISGPGGITAMGQNVGNKTTLYGTNTYSGGTTVSNGVLDVRRPEALAPNELNICMWTATCARLNYAGTRIIDVLILDGVKQDDGIYGSTNSTATFKSTFFDGTGTVTVLGPLVIDVTNLPPGVTTVTDTTQYIAGTNNFRLVGGMTWTNTFVGVGGVLDPAPQNWSFTTDLNPGYNTIIVSGTNVVGRVAVETVVVSRATAPYVDITNGTAKTVGMYADLAMIGGTNNAGSVGGMELTSVAGGATNYAASIPVATFWTATVSNLVAGMTNVVTITVTNALTETSTDTIAIYRRPVAVVDITNIVGMIYTTNTVQTIAGTNNAFIVGGMVWTNTLGGNGTLNPAPGNWSFPITVYPSNNVVTVYGTNAAGELATDTVIVAPPSTSNSILSCNFGPWGNATISGTNVTIDILPVAPLTALAPTFVISDYATIIPPSGTTNDFTTPKTYVVTSQSGSNKAYRVAVRSWQHHGSLYVVTTPDSANLPGVARETNFPLLLRLNVNNFTFGEAQADGRDVRFCSPAGVVYPCQIEEWTPTAASIWIRVPTVDGNAQQEFVMCWGNTNVSSVSSGPSVFNTTNNFVAAIHLSPALQDETGTVSPINSGSTDTQGIIGRGRHFNAGQGINCGTLPTNWPLGNVAHSSMGWFKADAIGGTLFGWGSNTLMNGRVQMTLTKPPAVRVECSFSFASVQGNTPVALDQWIHVAHTYAGGVNSASRLYVNGVLDSNTYGTLTMSVGSKMHLGGLWGTYDYAGELDEVKISKVRRSPEWVKLEYENQKILQMAVGTIVKSGVTFSTVPTSITMNENTMTNLTSQAGGARKVSWVYRKDGMDTLLAVDQFSLAFNPGRVSGNQSFSIQFRGIYAGEVKTNDVPVTVIDTIPDPAFTLLSSTNLWDGRTVMTVTTNIANWAALLSSGYTNLTYSWTVDGVAVTKQITPGTLVLTRAQGSGDMTVRLVLDNGGAKITNSVVIPVQEPASEPWIVRTPDANEKPVNNQFYGRDDTGYGTLYYNGTQGGTSPNAFLKVYTNGVLYTNIVQTLGGGGSYAFTAKIPAGLIQHTVEYGTGTFVLATVANIVCGDAYLVDGQSNAVTSPDDGAEPNPYTNLWIRNYGLTLGWGYGTRDGSISEHKIGHWEMDVASNIVAVYGIPICIINGAIGGTRIDEHMPGASRNIFRDITNRVTKARLTHGIRGAFWHQGENNSGTYGPDPDYDYKFYKQYFVDMTAAWKAVMPNLRYYYLFQVFPAPCGMGPCGDQIRDVQRNLPRMFSPRMKIMSTVGNQPGIWCHTPRAGYLYLANLTMPLVYQDNYGYAPGTTNTAPNLRIARFSGTSQVVLEFDQNVGWNPLATDMFYLDDVGGKVASGSAAGNTITLNLTGPSSAKAITYVDDQQNWSGTVTNHILWGNNGVAALTFADVSLVTTTTTNVPSDVLNLVVGRGATYGQTQLSWSNGLITVLACTNRSYTTNMSYWFVLASGVSTPWTHTAASNFPSVYYRIVGGSYTSEYAVGKYDVDIAPGSIAWLSFPFAVQAGCDIVAEWFGQQLEARYNTSYDFPSLQRQSSPGGTIEYSDYYIADLGNGSTNWFPTNTVVANAGYVLFLPQNHGAVKVTGLGMVQTNNVTMQLPYNSIPWVGLSYDVVMDMRQSGLTNMLQPPRLYSTFNYDFVDSQQTPGGPIWYAEYYRDNWGGNTVNFFPSETGADMLEPGKGYLLFFSTSRAGTGTWTCTKPY